MDLLQYSSSGSESSEEMDKDDDIRAESSANKSSLQLLETTRQTHLSRSSSDAGKKSKDSTTRNESVEMELSEDSDGKSTPRKRKNYSPERRSREREITHKKSKSHHRDRSEERRRRRSDDGRSRHHSSRDDYNERRHRTDKHRHNDDSSRRDDRRRRDKYDSRDERSHKNRSNSDRSSGRYSESDKYKRSNRRRSRSRTPTKSRRRDSRHRSHSRSKEEKKSDVISKGPSHAVSGNNSIDQQKMGEKSPELPTILAPPINTVNPVAAERKLAKLDQLGITLHANTLTATSSTPGGVKLPEGVEIPAYYNPNAINVTKYAEQIQKRKLLWSGKKTEPVAATNTWNKATFSQDTDGKVASKFMRLMGIKDGQPSTTPESGGESDLDKQKKLFSTMEQQYEVARQVTHTMRGVGLGFGSQPRQF